MRGGRRVDKPVLFTAIHNAAKCLDSHGSPEGKGWAATPFRNSGISNRQIQLVDGLVAAGAAAGGFVAGNVVALVPEGSVFRAAVSLAKAMMRGEFLLL